MKSNKYQERTGSVDKGVKELEKEELWQALRIDFLRVAQKFPNNKIYAIIEVKPETARTVIQNFELIVNDYKRGEFPSTYQDISISGFDIKKTKKVNIQIRAIPTDPNWKTIKKESKSRDFFFTDEILSLSPVINFEWLNDNSDVNVLVKWYHVNDRSVQKYVLCLDNKEIHYINQRSFSHELETGIHFLEPGEVHTVQIISKLNNRKEKCRSDLIRFTIPYEKDEGMTELLTVCNEPVPSKLLAFIELENEEKIPLPELDPYKDQISELHPYKDRILELLQRLQDQIEKRTVK